MGIKIKRKGGFIMAYYAYHRTSTEEQKLDRGINEIRQFCKDRRIQLFKDKVYTDQFTGKSFNRPTYSMLREMLDSGDTLIISELDRLGRIKDDILKELQYYKGLGVRVMILEIPTTLVDFSDMENSMSAMLLATINTVIIEVYAAMAQAELEKLKKRQREGYEALRASGKWEEVMGRPRALAKDTFEKDYKLVLEGKLRPVDLMRKHNLSRATYYRYRDDYKKENNDGKEVKLEVNMDFDDVEIVF